MKIDDAKKKSTMPIILLAVMSIVTIIGMIAFKIAFSVSRTEDGKSSNKTYDRYYAFISSEPNDDMWQNIYEGALSAGEESNSFVEQFGAYVGDEYTVEQKLEIAIAAEVDGIIIEGADSRQMRDSINAAFDKGIPVVTIDQDTSDCKRVSFVGINNYELGRQYGEEIRSLAKSMIGQDKESVNTLVLIGKSTSSNVQNLLSGIREELSSDNILNNEVIVGVKEIKDKSSFEVEEEIRDIFVGDDAVPDIIVCVNQLQTTCLAQAVVDYNYVGRTNIIGNYDSEAILVNVDKEIIYSTITIDDKQMGEFCVDALDEYVEHGYVNEYFVGDTYRINKENISEYIGGNDEEE